MYSLHTSLPALLSFVFLLFRSLPPPSSVSILLSLSPSPSLFILQISCSSFLHTLFIISNISSQTRSNPSRGPPTHRTSGPRNPSTTLSSCFLTLLLPLQSSSPLLPTSRAISSAFCTFQTDRSLPSDLSQMALSHQNNRASLLAGLRTGGVRSSSANVPHTAAPGATFNFPRFASHHEEPEYDSEPQDIYVPNRSHHGPVTSAVDGARFSYQQSATSQINPAAQPFTPSVNVQQAQNLQIQMMQMEILRLQVSPPPIVFPNLLIHFLIPHPPLIRHNSIRLNFSLKPNFSNTNRPSRFATGV